MKSMKVKLRCEEEFQKGYYSNNRSYKISKYKQVDVKQ